MVIARYSVRVMTRARSGSSPGHGEFHYKRKAAGESIINATNWQTWINPCVTSCVHNHLRTKDAHDNLAGAQSYPRYRRASPYRGQFTLITDSASLKITQSIRRGRWGGAPERAQVEEIDNTTRRNFPYKIKLQSAPN